MRLPFLNPRDDDDTGDIGGNPEFIELVGHWHIFAGQRLTTLGADPICIMFDPETDKGLNERDPTTWQAVIMYVEDILSQ